MGSYSGSGSDPDSDTGRYPFTLPVVRHLARTGGLDLDPGVTFLVGDTSEIERLDRDPGSPPLLPAYGGISPHERSHGQSFLDLVTHRFGPGGLYLLDEPEAALSPRGCMALVARIAELVAQGSQFVVATHSPILLAVPGARILQIDGDGEIERVGYDDAEPVTLTRGFLARPDRFLRHLLTDE